uniref:Uncharacterized protein n=1 Tax=Shewanella sp. (strain MR-7) TaxID=60481 RepID=Q0HVQ6_SHESR
MPAYYFQCIRIERFSQRWDQVKQQIMSLFGMANGISRWFSLLFQQKALNNPCLCGFIYPFVEINNELCKVAPLNSLLQNATNFYAN